MNERSVDQQGNIYSLQYRGVVVVTLPVNCACACAGPSIKRYSGSANTRTRSDMPGIVIVIVWWGHGQSNISFISYRQFQQLSLAVAIVSRG